MTTPEGAFEAARAAAASMRAGGAYRDDPRGPELVPADAPTIAKLFEWALIDPDVRQVRSTRRLSAPITALKRGLLRLLAQYHAELIAEQARFNVHLVRYLRQLEERVTALEQGNASPPADQHEATPHAE